MHFGVDIVRVCCGCRNTMDWGGTRISAGSAKRALVLVGDTAMRMGNPKDKSRGPLFGDSGTALALEFDTTAEDILIEFNTMGSGYQALMTPHGGYRHPVTQESFVEENFGNGIIRAPKDALIKGMDVFSFAITKPSIGVKKMLEQEGLDKDKDVDYFLIHQANKLIVDRLVKKLKLPKEKVPYNLQKFGNLGGASILMLMVSEIAEDLSLRPLTLLCSSFGLGLTWGTMILKTQPLIVLPLNKL